MRVVVGLAVAITAWMLPAVARPCSPRCEWGAVLPDGDSTPVPTNTKIWLLGDLGEAVARKQLAGVCGADRVPTLETAAGTPVDTELTALAHTSVLTPKAPLIQGERYRVRIECPELRMEDVEFTVSADADETRPDPPSIEVGKFVDEEDPCFHERYHQVDARDGGPLFVIDANADARVDDGFARRAEGIATSVTALGHAGCTPGYWPTDETARTYRFAALDLAGNLSAWTAPIEVRMSSCACAADGERDRGALVAWAGLLVLGLGRRRRRHSRASSSCATSSTIATGS